MLDLEYRQHPYRFAGGAAVTRRHGKTYIVEVRNIHDLMSFVNRPEKRIIYAHWGARADFPIILHYGSREGRGARGGIYSQGGLIRFWYGASEYRDSLRLLISGVDKVGEAVGLKKAKLPYKRIFSVDLDTRCEAASNHAWIVYLALEEMASRLDCDISRLPLTAGRAGLIDLERYMQGPWLGLTGWESNFCEHARYGGRCELLWRGEHDASSIDISSSYPASLLEDIPTGTPVVSTGFTSKTDFAFCIMDVPRSDYPPLPFRHEHTLFFPTGVFAGTWTGEEIRYAITQDASIQQVRTALTFRDRLDLSGWVTGHYEARKNDPFSALYTKIMLNAVIGKWGQNRPQAIIGYGEGPRLSVPLGSGYWSYTLPGKVPKFQNFAAAATALSRPRIRLHQLMLRAGTVFAVDTDNVIIPGMLTETPGLGGLHIEGTGQFCGIAPKVYAYTWGKTFREKWAFKCKGAVRRKPADAKEEAEQVKLMRQLIAGNQVVLKGIPTQLQLWERGVLDFLDLRDYRLHLDREKRCYNEDGSSRAWTADEIIEGAYRKPLRDRGIFKKIARLLNK